MSRAGGFCNIFKCCFTMAVVVYGFCHITLEMISTIVPIGLLIVAVVSMGLFAVKLAPPDEDVVESVIGRHLTDASDNPTDYFMKSMAHRGAGLDAPENTLAAFETCHKKGCTAVELDVALTLDNVAVIFHDDDLERMADLSITVAGSNWHELEKIDVSVKHPFRERFEGATIPTLDGAVRQLLKSGQKIFFDVKNNDGKMIATLLDLYEKYPELYSNALVTSFYPTVVYYIRRANPRIVSALIWRPHFFARTSYHAFNGDGERRTTNYLKHLLLCFCDSAYEWLLPRLIYDFVGCSVVCLHKDVISPKVVADWRKRGQRVVAWTVNHPVEKQYFARTLKTTYMTDTWTGEGSAHSN